MKSNKHRVSLTSITKAIVVLENLNKLDLKDIIFINGEEEYPVSEKEAKEWHFVGLNNVEFVKDKILDYNY